MNNTNILKPFTIQEISPKSFVLMNGKGRGCCIGVYKTMKSAKAGLEWAQSNPELARYYAGDSVNAALYDIAIGTAKVVNLGKWMIATPVYRSNPRAGYLQPRDYSWGIDPRFGQHSSRADAARAYFVDYRECSDQWVLGHYQRIHRNMQLVKIVKSGSLPELESIREIARS
jgi:hypothetical protein